MTRTQVYLDDSAYVQIQILAQQMKVPAASLIRKYVSTGIKIDLKKRGSAREALLNLAKQAKLYKGKKGPSDLSINHDYYLYGGERRNIDN